MQTIIINGTEYVGLREIEKSYGFYKSKAWLLATASDLTPIRIAASFFYPAVALVDYINKNAKKQK